MQDNGQKGTSPRSRLKSAVQPGSNDTALTPSNGVKASPATNGTPVNKHHGHSQRLQGSTDGRPLPEERNVIDTTNSSMAGGRARTKTAPREQEQNAPRAIDTAMGDMDVAENINVKPAKSATVDPQASKRGGSKSKGKGRAPAKGRKRKREGEGDEGSDSEDSEVSTPIATTTKSGRSIQRPTSFVPPAAASPAGAPAIKKKRVWRRNPENAVCKICLRGVSPASNMIVFCDGCNTPYHRWCHHPPIDQSVIDETDKEWYCRQCRRERIVPVAEADVAHFVPAAGASFEERQKYFSSLTPGALVTLLTRITSLSPSLPLFDPEFASKHAQSIATSQSTIVQQQPAILGMSTTSPRDARKNVVPKPATIYVDHDDEDEDDGYGPLEHPAHYVRPGKGLMSTLPPDKVDESYLVDEESSKGVFHHIYLVDEVAANGTVET